MGYFYIYRNGDFQVVYILSKQNTNEINFFNKYSTSFRQYGKKCI